MKKLVFTLLISLIGLQSAMADQCMIVSNAKAKEAKTQVEQLLSDNSIVVIDKFCEACMDVTPEPLVVDNVKLKNSQVKGFMSLSINNVPVDLAYIYINGENLAAKIGCRTFGVSQYL